MREPKPFVVGISWVVECTEQRRRVEEDKFIVDLEGLNIAGNNKVSFAFSHCSREPEQLIAPTFDAPQTHILESTAPYNGSIIPTWL
jgi:hypothetical protein